VTWNVRSLLGRVEALEERRAVKARAPLRVFFLPRDQGALDEHRRRYTEAERGATKGARSIVFTVPEPRPEGAAFLERLAAREAKEGRG